MLSWVSAGIIILIACTVAAVSVTLPGCGACHSSRTFVGQTAAGAHPSVPCVRCHVATGAGARVAFASREVFAMTLRLGSNGRAASAVDDEICLSCHRAVLGGVAAAKGYRIQHSTCADGRACSDCHSGTAHGDAVRWSRSPQMDRCISCHLSKGAASGCDVCHDVRPAKQRLASGIWAAIHTPGRSGAHGMGDTALCAGCHERRFCSGCHGIDLPHGADFLRKHAEQAASPSASCVGTCHQRAFCDDCHGLAMPHAASFTSKHADEVEAKGEQVCLRCHEKSDCDRCHEKHMHPGGASAVRTGGAR